VSAETAGWSDSSGTQRRGEGNVKALPKRLGVPLVASLAAVVVASLMVELAASNSITATTAAPSDSLETWQRWGMSIQHPPGLATYLGFEEPNATSNSGIVRWVWNNGGTSLTLFWANAPQSEIHAGLPRADEMQRGTEMTDVVLGDGGNITMNGAVWAYQTYTGMTHGETAYAAVATSYYLTSHRLYVLVLVDRNSTSLATLVSYGRTFRG